MCLCVPERELNMSSRQDEQSKTVNADSEQDKEKELFSIFLRIKKEEIEEKSKVKVLEERWGKKYPAAKILKNTGMRRLRFDNNFPSRKSALKYLKTEEGKEAVEKLNAASKLYNELLEAEAGNCSKRIKDSFNSMKEFMAEDFDNGKEINNLSRYIKRNGMSPFEREKENLKKENEVKSIDFRPYLKEIIKDNIDGFEAEIETMLRNADFIVSLKYYAYYATGGGIMINYPPHFTKTEIRKDLSDITDDVFKIAYLIPLAKENYKFKLDIWFRDELDKRIKNLDKYSHKRDSFGYGLLRECGEAGEELCRELKTRFPKTRIRQLIDENKTYENDLEKYRKTQIRQEEERKTVLEKIPEKYKDSFPDTRKMHRKFVLHIGPTNSGKTYEAIEALKSACEGIYLAPLRLLAFEQYENLTSAGIPCSMVTGEERIFTENSLIQASTIEMLPIDKYFDIAVIDEAQMISDKDRGGAWCTAMYGIKADEIHVCAAPEAENILKRIIEDCDDEYEVVHHERLSELDYGGNHFEFPDDVEPGDALICFSRKNVHAVASELLHKGIHASVIYGALPYDVRHEEARRFASGENSVVVATDAIGMGMNLPIKRVVFLEVQKYDGTQTRHLKTSEVKQIAGRAGRYGIYPTGTVMSCGTDIISKRLSSTVPEIRKIIMDFPKSLVTVPGKLSKTISIWASLPNEEMFEKTNCDDLLMLTKWCEQLTSRKDVILQFASIPFDVKDEMLLSTWKQLFKSYIKDDDCDLFDYIKNVYDPESKKIENLEQQYEYLDLLYGYATKFDDYYCDEIMEEKRVLSQKITNILKKHKFTKRVCKCCGKELPWNYGYAMCQKCHDRMYPRYYDDYDEDYDEYCEE